jgi:hypothetical protein
MITKIVFPLAFILMGAVFLLVTTVFYPWIVELLGGLEARAGQAVPEFWNLSLILPIVRVIFLIVGAFLTVLGIAFFWIRFRPDSHAAYSKQR